MRRQATHLLLPSRRRRRSRHERGARSVDPGAGRPLSDRARAGQSCLALRGRGGTVSMPPRLGLAALLVPLALWRSASGPSPRQLDSIVENDNRTPAGRFRGDTLEVHLVVGMATWRPES